jgi:hypothetical protein
VEEGIQGGTVIEAGETDLVIGKVGTEDEEGNA